MLESDRGQVLDGIVRYGDELVVVLESKLGEPASDRQAREINLHGQPVAFTGGVRAISWRELLAAIADLADEERGLTSGAERIVLGDFLDLVDRHFPRLGPFSTLPRCGGQPFRIARRLAAIAGELGGEPARGNRRVELPGRRAVAFAYLVYHDHDPTPAVRLRMHPADTLQQARALYTRPGAPERVLALQERGWTVTPNFHFGHMAKGLAWVTSSVPVERYVHYWQEHIHQMGAIGREQWPAFWELLVDQGFAQATERVKFDRAFTHTHTHRQSASPRPGISCSYGWSLAEAERLDGRGELVGAIGERVDELLTALGEPTLAERVAGAGA